MTIQLESNKIMTQSYLREEDRIEFIAEIDGEHTRTSCDFVC